jgi:hypothetical protein
LKTLIDLNTVPGVAVTDLETFSAVAGEGAELGSGIAGLWAGSVFHTGIHEHTLAVGRLVRSDDRVRPVFRGGIREVIETASERGEGQ